MGDFIALSIRVLNETHNRLEKKIFKSAKVLPKDLYRIVLEYSLMSDRWTKNGYFDNVVHDTLTTHINSIQIIHERNDIKISMVVRMNYYSTRPTLSGILTKSLLSELYKWILGNSPNIRIRVDDFGMVAKCDCDNIASEHISYTLNILIWS